MKNPQIVIKILLLSLLVLITTACGSLVKRQTDSLSEAILNSEDITTIAQGSPTFLILADGLIYQSPDNEGLLLSGAKLYGAYGSMFAEDPKQKKLMADKALDYALRGACSYDSDLCGLKQAPIAQFKEQLQGFDDEDDVEVLFTLATNWLNWIQTNSADWNAVAELPRPRILLEHILEVDEDYDRGGAHLYMGAIDGLLPAAMGGKPELARKHFERAIELSEGQNLMVKVFYAESYAKPMFNRELYNRLLTEVIRADKQAPDLVLTNTIAQQQALQLLAEEADYF